MKHIHHILYCLLLIAGLSSCIADTILEDPDNGQAKAENALVMLSLSVPNTQLPSATRALTDDEAISSLHLLVFEDDELTAVTDITSKYLNANNGTFYVAIKESKKVVRLSLVANTNTSSLNIGSTREETLKSLTFSDANNLLAMPMYGEADTFKDGLSREVGNDVKVTMIRSLAQIVVQNNSTQFEKNFKLLGIEILNINANGYVATEQGAMTQSFQNISAEAVPINDIPTASAYVAETENNDNNKISVLVYAKFNGTECYYRLDMIKNSVEGNTEIEGLVRNYKYIFSLQNVQYAGYATRDEAINGDAANVIFNSRLMTLSAEESDILDITTDDYYFLGVNSSTLQLDSYTDAAEGYFAKLKVLTNNTEAGWVIMDAPEDIIFSATTGGTTSGSEARKVISVWISTKENKSFQFYITSGKIRKTITVKAKP